MAKSYVLFNLMPEFRRQITAEKPPDWLPQVEGVTVEFLSGPYDGLITVEAPELYRVAEITVDLIANYEQIRSTVSCFVLRDYACQADSPPPTPEKGG